MLKDITNIRNLPFDYIIRLYTYYTGYCNVCKITKWSVEYTLNIYEYVSKTKLMHYMAHMEYAMVCTVFRECKNSFPFSFPKKTSIGKHQISSNWPVQSKYVNPSWYKDKFVREWCYSVNFLNSDSQVAGTNVVMRVSAWQVSCQFTTNIFIPKKRQPLLSILSSIVLKYGNSLARNGP